VIYKTVPLMCDNSSAICLAQNVVFHGMVKYIKVRHHFLRDHVEKGGIVMKFIDIERQLADIFTKPLDASHFAFLRGELGICHPYGLVLGRVLFYFVYISYFFSPLCITFIFT
jgi:hypothetical protein